MAYLRPLEDEGGRRGQEEARKCFGKRKLCKVDKTKRETKRHPETRRDRKKQ